MKNPSKRFLVVLSIILFMILLALCAYIQNGLRHFSLKEWDSTWQEKVSGTQVKIYENSLNLKEEESFEQEISEVHEQVDEVVLNSELLVESNLNIESSESELYWEEESSEESYDNEFEESVSIEVIPETSVPNAPTEDEPEAEDTGRANELPIG